MVMTKKFSEFTEANLNDQTNKVVGFGGGVNFKSDKVTEWTTAGRPATPFNGLLGYNTDLSKWEYYSSNISAWVQLLTSSSGMDWSEITVVSITANVNNGYAANRAFTPVNIQLPAVSSLGDKVVVIGKGAGGWSLIANAGQIIVFGNQSSSMAGSISSTLQFDNVEVTCLTNNLVWEVTSVIGNLTII